MRTLRAALVYFALVFAAGFVLGTLRTLWLEPALGERRAELLEMPFMLIALALAARFVARGEHARPRSALLGVGLLALALLLLAEAGVVVFLRHQSIAESVRSRDPVSGTAYLLALVCFALAPRLLAR